MVRIRRVSKEVTVTSNEEKNLTNIAKYNVENIQWENNMRSDLVQCEQYIQ